MRPRALSRRRRAHAESGKRKVCIIQSVLKQYRVPLFDALYSSLKSDGIELQVLYSDPLPVDSLRGDNVETEAAYARKVHARWMFGERLVYQSILPYVRDADLVIVEQANKYLLNYWLLMERKLGRKCVAFWGHGRNRQAHGVHFSEWLKRKLLNQVDWWFAYTQGTASYLVDNGVDPDRITSVQNATDTTTLQRLVADIEDNEVVRLRERLGIEPEAPVGLFVGSLYDHKLLPLLLSSAPVIANQVPQFTLVIVGGGPEIMLVREASRKNPAIIYAGPRFGRDLAVYYRMASVFLNPGLIGLAMLDAFASGLPVVTTDYPYHSPEIEYLEKDLNGLVTGSTPEEFGDGVTQLLLAPERLSRMREYASKSSSTYTIEAMVANFRDGILACLPGPQSSKASGSTMGHAGVEEPTNTARE